MRTMPMIALTETTMTLENPRCRRVIATVVALACGLFAYSDANPRADHDHRRYRKLCRRPGIL